MTPSRMLPLLALPLAVVACSADRSTAARSYDAAPATPAAPAGPVEPPETRAGDGAERVVQPVAGEPAEPAAGTGPRAEVVDGGSGRWTLRVTLPAGAVVTGTVTAEPGVRPTVLGVTDADRDGDDEVFVRVGAGASTSTYVAFTLVEDGLAEVRTTTGDALRLVVGGGVRHGDGLLCETGSITTLAAASDDGETYRGTSTTYSWRDDVVTETRRGSFTGGADDPAVRAAYGIDCNTLQQG